MSAVHPRERVVAWRPPVPGVSEVFHAEFLQHAYPPHTHGTWTLFIVDEGEIAYGLDRHSRGARPSMVSLLPPHVVHDGRPATTRGYRKRVVYLTTDVIGERLIGRAVDRSAFEDRRLRSAVESLHVLLRDPAESLAAEARLAFVAERLVEHLTGAAAAPAAGDAGHLALRLRELLDEQALGPVTLAAAGAQLGASGAHLVRAFTRTFGIPPHAYVIGRRIEAARARLLDGEPIAQVAAAVGFYDQAHLSRHFKRHVGTTPGEFARGRRLRAGSPRMSRAGARTRRAPRPRRSSRASP